MNKVEIIGRPTKDIELRYTSSQMAVAKFILAVKRRKKDSNEADFIPCTALGKNAETMEKFVKKGQRIGIVGRIQTGTYKAKDGSTHYSYDVVVDELYLLEKKQSSPEDDFQIIDEPLPF